MLLASVFRDVSENEYNMCWQVFSGTSPRCASRPPLSTFCMHEVLMPFLLPVMRLLAPVASREIVPTGRISPVFPLMEILATVARCFHRHFWQRGFVVGRGRWLVKQTKKVCWRD